ncbi:MAG: poly(R)-hydroxyalkanoic acid synthase [Bacteroidetes bacterium]|jgi:polyhydroxyalkanoate synthase|nr:poly(R)-hydroxyalkanoic acid synthase [Bacteroidota bacterium]
MQENGEFTYADLMGGLNKAGQKLIGNYFKNFTGYRHDSRSIVITYLNFWSKIAINPHEIYKINTYWLDYLQSQQKIWNSIFLKPEEENSFSVHPKKNDKRFVAEEWNIPYFDFIRQNYLLTERLAERIIAEIEIGDKARKKMEFYNQHFMDLFSPANFLATNPEALKLAVETKGKSLVNGFQNLVKDIEKGQITQTDESAFEVGKNLAVTKGAVIYENKLMQLIQYSPATKEVHEIPILMIPPWINKFYILDLQAENSFVKFMVEKGITVYVISWRNPCPGTVQLSFDDYVQEGAMKAIQIAKDVSGVKKINTLGYCLGGTLLGVASAILSKDEKNNPINSATFLAAMIDFIDVGPMGNVIDEALVRKLDRGELLHDGVLHGHDMEHAFNLIRSHDLIWNYAVNSYLKGLKPSAFDVLYWTNDNTNLPAEMYKYYIRHIILENGLSRKNALTICGKQLDIGKIEFPVFVIGFTEDYISPAKTVFITTRMVSGPVEFILGGSGHVMGAINPPSKKKYGYYLNGKLEGNFDHWKETAQFFEGSWWNAYSERLIAYSGNKVPAKKELGNKKFPVIEEAPGAYVKESC